MSTDVGFPVIAHAIQLAIAPVFLLTGIAGLLGVMANRLSRVVDRARYLEQTWDKLDDAEQTSALAEINDLERRRLFASWSINLCTTAALIVCLVIVTLFVEEFFSKNLRWIAGSLFVCAMFALIGGLFSFLREVYLATTVVRIDTERFKASIRAGLRAR